MIFSEILNRKNIVLLETSTKKFILYPSTKEEINNIEELLNNKEKNEFLNSINMCGHISEVLNIHCRDIIPIIKEHKEIEYDYKNRETKSIIQEFKCYQEHKQRSVNNNVIKHEDSLTSFRCACQLLNVEYFLIIKEDKIELNLLKEFLDNYKFTEENGNNS